MSQYILVIHKVIMTLLLRIRPIYRPLYLLLPSVPKQAWIHHSSRLLQLPPTPPISPYNSQSQTPLTSTDSELELELDDVLDHFQAPIRYAFAYGSGVFRQQGYTSNVRLITKCFPCPLPPVISCKYHIKITPGTHNPFPSPVRPANRPHIRRHTPTALALPQLKAEPKSLQRIWYPRLKCN